MHNAVEVLNVDEANEAPQTHRRDLHRGCHQVSRRTHSGGHRRQHPSIEPDSREGRPMDDAGNNAARDDLCVARGPRGTRVA